MIEDGHRTPQAYFRSRNVRLISVFACVGLLAAIVAVVVLKSRHATFDLSQVTQRNGEKPVVALERYIRDSDKVGYDLRGALERYAVKVRRNEEIDTGSFATINRFWSETHGRDPAAVVQQFIDSPAGAYLSEQDKEYVRRLQKQLEDGHSQSRKEAEARIQQVNATPNAPSDGEVTDFFQDAPALLAVIRSTTIDDLRVFTDAIRDSMTSSSVSPELQKSFFLRPAGYYSEYEKERELVFQVLNAGAEDFMRVRRKLLDSVKQRWFSSVDRNYKMFLTTEAAYGLEGFNNRSLNRLGLYAAVGSEDQRVFQDRLRQALRLTYESLGAAVANPRSAR